MKKYKYILGLFVAFALLLSACQQAATPAEAPSAGSESEPAAPDSAAESDGEVIELAFWTLLGGSNGDRIQKLVDDFNASQDGIVIIYEQQGGYDDLQQKLLASLAAGDPPPITMVDYKYVPFYAKNGAFEPINNLASEEDLADYIPGLLTDLTYKGQVYAIPFNRSTQGMFYNKDLMREVGLDPEAPPETWAEMVEIGEAVKALGDDYYVTYGKESNAQWMFEPLVYQFGGRISDENCRFVFNEEGGVEVAEFLQKNIYDTDLFLIGANPVGNFDEVSFEWVQGKVLFTRSSTALQGSMEERVDFDWGFTKFPYAEGGTPAVTSGGANIAIAANYTPEEKAAAWEFVKFATNAENSAWFHMETGYMPTRYSVMELPEAQAYYVDHPTWLVSVDQLDYVEPTACGVFNAPEWQPVIQAAMDRIILNNEDAKTVLDEAAEQLNMTIDSIAPEELIK
ncbi:MAG: ABC transporter substrate-binding protein [Anaerolineaceae bacterium]|nr:ABC transporter substrate-binding protein [Anaerolineaceae bacterium]